MKKPDIDRVIEFHKLILQFRDIERKVRIPRPSHQPENDVEHSYSLAMMSWYLASHFPHLDRDKVLRFALIHDLVEVHAGDTFTYGDPEHVASKHKREAVAQKQLATDWPDFPDMHDAIAAYEARDCAEARFVYAVDKILPTILNYLGEGYGWQEHSLTLDDVRREKATKVTVSPEVNEYYEQLIALLEQHPEYFSS